MIYLVPATIVAVLHGLLLVVLFVGVLFSLLDKLRKRPVLEKTYLAFASLMIASYVFTGGCYLTDIEQWLWRKAHSPFVYSGGCVSHYLGLVGINVDDNSVYWALFCSLVLGLGSYIFRILSRELKTRTNG